MKKDTIKLEKEKLKASKLYIEFRMQTEVLFNLIKPYINYDVKSLAESDVLVDYLTGDGFAFMLDDEGVPIDEIIDRISKLKDGEKINLSELKTYL